MGVDYGIGADHHRGYVMQPSVVSPEGPARNARLWLAVSDGKRVVGIAYLVVAVSLTHRCLGSEDSPTVEAERMEGIPIGREPS